MLVETINVCENGPCIMTCTCFILPPRMLTILNVQVELRGNPQDHTYKVKPNSFLTNQYQNMVVIHTIHILLKQTATVTLFVLGNLVNRVCLSK